MPLDPGKWVRETSRFDGGRALEAYVPSGDVDAIVYAADGGWHVDGLRAALEAAGHTSTLLVGVHGQQEDDARLAEYVPGFDAERFAAHERFFVEEVPGWVATRLGLTLPRERTAVWGASLGAEHALAVGLRHPDRYGVVLAASPGAGYRPPEVWPSPLPRCYLVAGTEEPFFRDNARVWTEALSAAGAEVVMTERAGSHGDRFWLNEFARMVPWAFGP